MYKLLTLVLALTLVGFAGCQPEQDADIDEIPETETQTEPLDGFDADADTAAIGVEGATGEAEDEADEATGLDGAEEAQDAYDAAEDGMDEAGDAAEEGVDEMQDAPSGGCN